MSFKLREKFLIPVVFTIAAGIIAGFFYAYLTSTRAIEESVRKALSRETRNTAKLMDNWLEARQTDLLTWSRASVFAEALTETGYYGKSAVAGANDLLENFEKGYSYYDFIFIADGRGDVISSSHNSMPKEYQIRDRVYFQASLKGDIWISDIIVSRESGKKVFVISVPLKKEGRIVGILAGAINIEGFSSFFIPDFELGQEGFAYMAQGDGMVMSVSDPAISLGWIDTHEFGQTILATGKGSLVFRFQQRQWISAYETLDNKKWVFVVTQSLDEAFGATRKIGWYTGIIGLVSLILIGLVVAFLFRKLVYKRFDRMLDVIGKVEKGELDVRITGGDENDEIGALSKAFNRMTDRLRTTLSSLHGEIQVRKEIEASLARHRDTLEVSVAQRTSELISLQNYLSDVINSMPSIIVGVTHEMEITQWNLKAEEFTGISGKLARGSLFQDRFPHLKWMAKDMADAVGDKKVFFKARVARPDEKRPGYEDITLYPLMAKEMKGAVIRIDDMTEQAALEASMIQTEKMFSLGGLAAGMAHEINNPLAGIIQNIQVMKNRFSPDLPPNRKTAEEMNLDLNLFQNYMEERGMFKLMDSAVMAGGRAAAIVDNMLSFSRQESAHLSDILLSDLMDQAIELTYNDYSLKKNYDFKNIKIIRHYAAQDLRIKGHPSMLQQVFFNLLKNGAQAMAENPLQREPQFTISIKIKGSRAFINLSDNGPGMDKEVCPRIFEPFYTTKEIGKGTGLGLSVSYFIIAQNHSGTIEVMSDPGKGTSFLIELPVEGPALSTGINQKLEIS